MEDDVVTQTDLKEYSKKLQVSCKRISLSLLLDESCDQFVC